MTQSHFYAQEDDISLVLNEISGKIKLSYIVCGFYRSGSYDKYDDYREIPGLGTADARSSIQCREYLIIEQTTKLISERIERSGKYLIGQHVNADSITAIFGGLWNGDAVISGRVATPPDSPIARKIIGAFQRSIKKHFVKVRAFYVGPKAMSSLKAGRRLTSNEHSPREYDLAL